MSLTREDMLRELELLPVWHLNVSLEPTVSTPPQAMQEAAPNDAPVAPQIEPVVEIQEEPNQSPALPDIANMDWAELKQHVVGSGDKNADWVFVGDVSSEGDAGVLLDKMLIAIQLQRGKNVYITQVTELDFLNRQIALIQPKLIFAFGEKSAQILLDSNESLDALRGKVHQYHGVALIVSYSPSHLLHHTQDKSKAWADLCLAKSAVDALK